ncbi:stAR-related lipid transfer protein 6 isoform X1 [Aquila chrysaetos chrysaetos]|uniref:stAR-related lipid transfer protein 6 isoform X1 n=2 Tax=Aquila chrysaetos chrysaetos TaxID=223781 RepID=UPI0005D05817|nr:stAR-related lipid transfer protein 6 isoform X1 [Aquila chrysaetos chrysaetos]XP_029859572.1 stAR-related lipid transfer protein 6 isoform X1 [Aquila chrysaetos chrysaetos]
MDYKKIADEVSEKILSYSQDTSGWRVIKISKNVTVSSKPSKEYAGNIYRGEGIIKEVPSKIIPFMYLPEYRNKWDKALQSYKLLERIDQDTGIYHSVTHSYGMGLISSRDFVDLLHVKPYPGDILTTNSVSVEYSSCPPTPSCVRGYNNACGYVCSPLPEFLGASRKTTVLSCHCKDCEAYALIRLQHRRTSKQTNTTVLFYRTMRRTDLLMCTGW